MSQFHTPEFNPQEQPSSLRSSSIRVRQKEAVLRTGCLKTICHPFQVCCGKHAEPFA